MCRHGVHAHSGIAHAGKMGRHQAVRINAHQRVGVTCADQRHGAEPASKTPRDFHAKFTFRHSHELLDRMPRQGKHYRGTRHACGRIVVHRQQRQGLAIIEPFPRHVFVRHGMRHHEYHHGAPKIMHVRSNPHRAADGGETAVGCHQQTAAQACAIVQLQLRALVVAVGLDDLLAAHQRDVAVLGHAILHTVISCLADQVIGCKPAQFAGLAVLTPDHHGKCRRAVEYLRILQRRQRNRIQRLDAFPQTQLPHEPGRMLCQGDFPPVEGRFFKSFLLLLLHHGNAQAVAGKRPRQTQACWSRARYHYVIVHSYAV